MAISRDTGSAYPITLTSAAPGASVTTGTFSTNAAVTRIVVVASWASFDGTAVQPLTVAWNGGTPGGATGFTKRVEFIDTGTGANTHGTSIWTADTTSTQASQAVVVTANATAGIDEVAVLVDAIVGASTVTGTTGGQASASGSSVARSVTLAGVTSGAWIYVGANSETIPLSPVTDTTEAAESPGSTGVGCAVGYNTTGTAGSITVGWSASAAFSSCAALEVDVAVEDSLAATTEAEDSVDAYGPFGAASDAFQASGFQVSAFQPTGTVAAPASDRDIAEIGSPTEAVASRQVGVSALSESTGPADAQAAANRILVALAETATPSDTVAGVLRRVGALSETASPGEVVSSTQGGASARTETASPTDALVGAATIPAALAESAAGADAISGLQLHASSLTEAATAADIYTSSVSTPAGGKDLSETGSPTDAYATLQRYASTVSEAASAADAYAAVQIAASALAATTTPADTVSASQATGNVLDAAATATDSVGAYQRFAATLAEAATAAESCASAVSGPTAGRDLAAGATATDALASIQRHAVTLAEAATASDEYGSTLRHLVALAESVSALDSVSAGLPVADQLFLARPRTVEYSEGVITDTTRSESQSASDSEIQDMT